MTWTRLPPLPGKGNPCLCCPPIGATFHPRQRIAVGFGDASLRRDGEVVWSESGKPWEKCITGRKAENIAAKDPDHDWRIVLYGPMHGESYQRQAPGEWVLVETNQGFA